MSANAEWVEAPLSTPRAAVVGSLYGEARLEGDEYGLVIGVSHLTVIYSQNPDDLVDFATRLLILAEKIRDEAHNPGR